MRKVNLGLGGGSFIQIENKSPFQSMGYLIVTPENDVIMLDGGNIRVDEDGEFLHKLLLSHGGNVRAWLFTHPHDDHIGAFTYIMENYDDISVGEIYESFPPDEWVSSVENGSMIEYIKRYRSAVDTKNIPVKHFTALESINIGGLKIIPLNTPDNYNNYTTINDSSVALKIYFPKREVLFLGDLAKDGEKDFSKEAKSLLPTDIVQMAHHGQYGVSEDFYKLIMPKITLWPTPLWLWENECYAGDYYEGNRGPGSGPFDTLNTRAWMRALKIKEYYTAFMGDTEFY